MGISRKLGKRLMAGVSAGAMMLGSLTLTSAAQADVDLTPRIGGQLVWAELLTAEDSNVFGLNGTEYPQLSPAPSGLYSLGRVTARVKWPRSDLYVSGQVYLVSCPTAAEASCGATPPRLGEPVTVRSEDQPGVSDITYVPTAADIGRYVRIRQRVISTGDTPLQTRYSDPVLMLGTPPRDTDNMTISWGPSEGGNFVTDGSQVIVNIPRWRSGNMNFDSRIVEMYQCPNRGTTDFGTCTRLDSTTFTTDESSNWRVVLPTLSGAGFLKVAVRGVYRGAQQTSFRQIWVRSSSDVIQVVSQASIQGQQDAQDQAALVPQTCRDALGADAGTQGADPALNQAFLECLQNGGPTAEQLANQANGNSPDSADLNADDSSATSETTGAATAAIAASGARVVDSTATRAGVTMSLASVRAIKRGRRLVSAVAVTPRDAAATVTMSIHRCKKVDGKRDCTVPGKRVQKLKRINVTDGIGVSSSKVRKQRKPGTYALRAIVRDADGKPLVVSAQPLRIRK